MGRRSHDHEPDSLIAPAVYRTINRILESVVLIAAMAIIPLSIVPDELDNTPEVIAGNWAVWSAFFAEFVIMLAITRRRRRYALRHWLDVVVIAISFPPLEALLALVLVPRLLRLLRLLRFAVIAYRGFNALQHVFIRQGLIYLFTLTGFLVLAAGGLLTVLEPDTVEGNYWEGVWWSVVTVTTVGYGDIVPETNAGRLVGAVLMLTGLGTVSALAGSVAAYFVGQDEDTEMRRINDRLDRIEALLGKIEAAQGPPPDG